MRMISGVKRWEKVVSDVGFALAPLGKSKYIYEFFIDYDTAHFTLILWKLQGQNHPTCGSYLSHATKKIDFLEVRPFSSKGTDA